MAKAERGRGARALAALLPKLAEPALRKRGFSSAALLARWPDIVGPALAADAVPDRLTFPRGHSRDGVLHLRVAGPAALELQHLAPQVIERINGFFGYSAVARLSLVQGPVEPPPVRRQAVPPAPVAPEQAARIERATAEIADADLRAALGALGRAVAGSSARREE